MSVLGTRVDPRDEGHQANRALMEQMLDEVRAEQAKVLEGGGEKYVQRHRDRGRLLARDRVQLLLDPGSPFLELAALAGWGGDDPVGGGSVQGIGVVEGTECFIGANDPTVRGGSSSPVSIVKSLRGQEIARANRLPSISLTESGGADLPKQADIFVPGGETFRNISRLGAEGIPTLSIVFGSSTAGGAYVPGMSEHTIFVRNQARAYLGGPPLVKMAIDEDADEEELGGADMHARRSGLADHLAVDEMDALRLGRQVIRDLRWTKAGPGPVTRDPDPPLHDPDELLGIASADIKTPFESREVIARIVDGSRFDDFKPLYGTQLVCGWAEICGFPVGILANDGILFSEESQKGAQFIQLANRSDTPLVFLQNITGFMVGTRYEQGGIIKHGSQLINAVSNSAVPHLTVMMGASYGAGNYGMSGRGYDPRFIFTWPNHRIAVMGPKQLAGVISIVQRQAAARAGRDYDEEGDAAMRSMIEAQIEAESTALFATGRQWDDGIIDPRDTRTVLGLALSATHSAPVQGSTTFGTWRL